MYVLNQGHTYQVLILKKIHNSLLTFISEFLINFLIHFSAAAFKAGKIAQNPFQNGPNAAAGAMIPPPASLTGNG